MKIAFLHIGVENLGLEYLSAILKQQGHQVHLFFDPSLFDDKFIFQIPTLSKLFNIQASIVKAVIAYQPDLIGFSVVTDTYRWSLEMATVIKRQIPTIIMFGGVHPTCLPERVIQEDVVDIVNVGEGFESMPELVESLEHRKPYTQIRNLWVKHNGQIIRNKLRPLFSDLDRLPFPDKTLFQSYINIGEKYLMITSLGCPYRCSFCSNAFYLNLYKGKGTYLRQRSPENVIEELKQARRRYNLKMVNIEDKVFPPHKQWLYKFASLYKQNIHLPYIVMSHPRYMDEDVIRLLKDSGCFRIQIGIQAMNKQMRNEILHRAESNREIERTFSLCDKHRLPYTIFHLYGLPTDDETRQMEAARVYSRYKPARIGDFWLVYYPKTPISEIGVRYQTISAAKLQMIEDGHVINYHDYGSVSDPQKRTIYNNFAVFFLLIPLLPKKINQKILASRLFHKLHLMPYIVKMLLEFLGGVKSQDYQMLDYARYYGRTLIKITGIKLKQFVSNMTYKTKLKFRS